MRTWVEGVALAPAVTGRVLLDAATYLTWSVASELDDVEGIEDAGCVLELIVDSVLSVPEMGPASRSGYRSETVRRALLASSHARCQTCLEPGPLKRAVGCSSPRVVHDASELTGTPSTSVLVMPHMLINPQHPNPRKTGRVIRCGLQTRLDMGPHGIPRSCQLSSQPRDSGSFEAQLSDRPADRPHTQTRPGSTHRVVLLNESHDPAGAFAAYPASLKPPEPCRDPGPGCVDHLHHHAPVALNDSAHNPGTPPAGCTTQHQAPEYLGCEPRSSDGSPPNRRADHNDHTDQATHSSSR